MYISLHVVLLLIIGIAILTLVVISLKKRKQPIRYYNSPELGLERMGNIPDDGIIAVRTLKSSSPKKIPSQQHNVDATLVSSLGLLETDPHLPELSSQKISANSAREHIRQDATVKRQSSDNDLLIITIMAQPGHQFQGYELLQSLLSTGLRYGKMSIFHRYQEANGNDVILFSLASATEPGIFDMNKIGVFVCNGLTLFMRLTGPEHNMMAFNLMLETAKQLSEELGGILTDNQHQNLTESTVVFYQERIRIHQQKIEANSID